MVGLLPWRVGCNLKWQWGGMLLRSGTGFSDTQVVVMPRQCTVTRGNEAREQMYRSNEQFLRQA